MSDKKAAYFSHDSNARSDDKMLAMRSVYKSQGYGWYWIILEMMRDANAYRLQCEGKYWAAGIAKECDTSPEKIEKFIVDCIDEFKLFKRDAQFFWSESFLRRMEAKDAKSLKAKESAERKWVKWKLEKCESSANAERSLSETSASKVKESKVKKNTITPNGVGNSEELPASPSVSKYEPGEKPELKYVHAYIRDNKPTDPEPYVDMWNIFATQESFPVVKKLSKDHERKLISRIREPAFDLAKILAKAKGSEFIRSGNWFNLRWLIKNESNFLKVLEGQYDNKIQPNATTGTIKSGPTAAEQKGAELLAEVYGTGSVNDHLRESAPAGS